jgi:hypothetical protein
MRWREEEEIKKEMKYFSSTKRNSRKKKLQK